MCMVYTDVVQIFLKCYFNQEQIKNVCFSSKHIQFNLEIIWQGKNNINEITFFFTREEYHWI